MKWFQDRYIPQPLNLCLSLGCGHGALERVGIALGLAKRFRQRYLKERLKRRKRPRLPLVGDKIEYRVADLNDCALPAATYDAIFASSSVHHVFQLEHVFRECRGALKPGGLFFLDEYIGPSRFQSAPIVVDIINRLRALLPEKYRKSLSSRRPIRPYTPTPIEHFEKHDPSEAVRSAEIVATLKMYFDLVEVRPYGGAIQHMMFSDIIENFDEHNENDVALLKLIATFEEILEEADIIQSDFAAIVATPRLAGSASLTDTNLTKSPQELMRLERKVAALNQSLEVLSVEMERRSFSLRWLLRSASSELWRRMTSVLPWSK